MLYCSLSTDGHNWRKLGQVSHLFHGLLLPGEGLKWCQLEILIEEPEGRQTGLAELLGKLPAPAEQLAGLQFFSGTNGDTYSGLTRHFASTGQWRFTCGFRELLALNFGVDEWFRGAWLSLRFAAQAGGAFDLGVAGSEIPTWQPTLPQGALDPATCRHGSAMRFDGEETAEYLHDLQVHEAEGSPTRVFRHEKESTQKNSLLRFALERGRNLLAGQAPAALGGAAAGAAGDEYALTYRLPNNPGTEAGRKDVRQTVPIDASFTVARGERQLQALHFMEVTGLFKSVSFPPPRVFRSPGADILQQPDYWISALDSILAARGARAGRGGADVPHEVITIVRA